jgi:hypothetical protein
VLGRGVLPKGSATHRIAVSGWRRFSLTYVNNRWVLASGLPRKRRKTVQRDVKAVESGDSSCTFQDQAWAPFTTPLDRGFVEHA